MSDYLYRMPPFKRGDTQTQTDDLREFLQLLVKQLNDEMNAPVQAEAAAEESKAESVNTNIGKTVTANGTASIANRAGAAAGSITLKKGIYILEASIVWQANSLGYRVLNCSETEGSVARINHAATLQSFSDAITLPQNIVRTVAVSKDTEYFCNCYQNSGTDLSVAWSLKATRIK